MPARTRRSPAKPAKAPTPPLAEPQAPSRPLLDLSPTAVYSTEQVRQALALKPTTLPREIRLRRLRVCKRGGKYYVLGAQVLEWLQAGLYEPPGTPRTEPAEGAH